MSSAGSGDGTAGNTNCERAMQVGSIGKSTQTVVASRLNIIHTIAGTRVDHGGTSRSVPNLVESLARLGVPVSLLAGMPADNAIESVLPNDSVHTRWVLESRVHRQYSIRKRFRTALAEMIRRADEQFPETSPASDSIIHDHGIWLGNNRAVAKVCRKHGLVRVVSPRGMVSKWSLAHGGLKKRIAWIAYQRADLFAATGFHATGRQEAQDLRRLGLEQPIAVIPNGIELPNPMPPREINPTIRKCLFLSRIHPKKGIPNLLHAWKNSMALRPDWRLLLVGPSEKGHRGELESLVHSLGLGAQVEFRDAVSDDQKWQLYRQADLFVLPSYSENFGIVVAEALAAGVPVVTTTATPWESLSSEKLGWWVEPEVDALSDALEAASGMPRSGLVEMGERGSEWAIASFAWDHIADQMIAFYEWLLDPVSDRPSFIV